MKAQLRLVYRQVIDQESLDSFDRRIFNQSYDEFLLKIQEYNPEQRFATFTDIVSHNPKANSLHYKLGLSVRTTVDTLHQRIPKLTNTFGQEMIPFEYYETELIESNVRNQAFHQIAIRYMTPLLSLLEVVGEYLAFSYPEKDYSGETIPTYFVVKMQLGLSLTDYQAFGMNRPGTVGNGTVNQAEILAAGN